MNSSPFQDGPLLPRTQAAVPYEYSSPDTDTEMDVLEYCNGLLADASKGAAISLDLLLERIYLVIIAQAERSLEAAGNHHEASDFRELLISPDFRRPMAWDFLAGTPSRVAVRRRISRLLQSKWVRDALIKNVGIDAGTIRELVKEYRTNAKVPDVFHRTQEPTPANPAETEQTQVQVQTGV